MPKQAVVYGCIRHAASLRPIDVSFGVAVPEFSQNVLKHSTYGGWSSRRSPNLKRLGMHDFSSLPYTSYAFNGVLFDGYVLQFVQRIMHVFPSFGSKPSLAGLWADTAWVVGLHAVRGLVWVNEN